VTNLYFFGALLSGVLGGMQGIVLGRAGRGGALPLAIVALSVVQALVPLYLMLRGQTPSEGWRMPIILGAVAGLMGTAILTLNGSLIRVLGAGTTFVLVIAGLVVSTVFADHLGLSGTYQSALQPSRLAGIALVLAGAWLISRT
jgi:transporter family-2 protein